MIIASTQLIYWRALFGTRYGGVLGLKLALIAFALAAAFRLRTLVLPRLRALDARDALQRARPLIVVELLCAFAAFMVALQLARTTPGAHAAIHWWLPWRLAPAAAWALPATPWLCAISACWQQGVPKIPPGGWKFPSVRPDLGWLRQNRAESTLTWIGHATFLLQVGGVNILTDPPLTARASLSRLLGPKRWVPPALT